MKTVSISEMKRLAEYYGGEFTNDLMPAIEYDGYGVEATEIDSEGNCYGFRFFGESRDQEKVMDLWAELTEVQHAEKMLTIERAKSLVGKKVEVAYRSNSGYEIAEIIQVCGIEERNERAIGQPTTHRLLFKKISDPLQPDKIFGDKQYDYYYEWQGIFRATGSAHKVYLKPST